jgi:dolichol-phosphate mannosyltransferase
VKDEAEAEDEQEQPPEPAVLVVTPTFDERENLRPFVESVFAACPRAHVLVVDDASPDGTGALADALAADDPRIHVLHRPGKAGLGTAYRDGFAWALARRFDVVVEMDADLSHDARYLPSFLGALAAGADVVVGSRGVVGGGVVGWGPFRHALSQGGSLYARTILGVDVRDLTTGFKAYSRRALEAIQPSTLSSNGYAFQIETTFRALAAGLVVRELPIVFVDRRAGKSKLSRRVFAEAVWMVWRLRLSDARRSG